MAQTYKEKIQDSKNRLEEVFEPLQAHYETLKEHFNNALQKAESMPTVAERIIQKGALPEIAKFQRDAEFLIRNLELFRSAVGKASVAPDDGFSPLG